MNHSKTMREESQTTIKIEEYSSIITRTFKSFKKNSHKIFWCFRKIVKFHFYHSKNSSSKKYYRLIAQIISHSLFKTKKHLPPIWILNLVTVNSNFLSNPHGFRRIWHKLSSWRLPWFWSGWFWYSSRFNSKHTSCTWRKLWSQNWQLVQHSSLNSHVFL